MSCPRACPAAPCPPKHLFGQCKSNGQCNNVSTGGDRIHRMILARTQYAALSRGTADTAKKLNEASIKARVKKEQQEEMVRVEDELQQAKLEYERICRERGQAHEFAKLIELQEQEYRKHQERRNKAVKARAEARAREKSKQVQELKTKSEEEKRMKKMRIHQYSNLRSNIDPLKKRYTAELDNLIQLEKRIELRLDEKKQKVLTEQQVERIAEKLLQKYCPGQHICCQFAPTQQCNACKMSPNPSPCNCYCNCKECIDGGNQCNPEGSLACGKSETNELSAIVQRVLEKLGKLKMDDENTPNPGSKENVLARSGSNKEKREAKQQQQQQQQRQRQGEEEDGEEEDGDGEEEEMEKVTQLERKSRLYKEAAVNTSTKSLSSFISSESSYAQLPSPIILRKQQKSSLRSATTIAKVIDESLASVESLDKEAFWQSVLRSADLL